jgi:hypothetical protein
MDSSNQLPEAPIFDKEKQAFLSSTAFQEIPTKEEHEAKYLQLMENVKIAERALQKTIDEDTEKRKHFKSLILDQIHDFPMFEKVLNVFLQGSEFDFKDLDIEWSSMLLRKGFELMSSTQPENVSIRAVKDVMLKMIWKEEEERNDIDSLCIGCGTLCDIENEGKFCCWKSPKETITQDPIQSTSSSLNQENLNDNTILIEVDERQHNKTAKEDEDLPQGDFDW